MSAADEGCWWHLTRHFYPFLQERALSEGRIAPSAIRRRSINACDSPLWLKIAPVMYIIKIFKCKEYERRKLNRQILNRERLISTPHGLEEISKTTNIFDLLKLLKDWKTTNSCCIIIIQNVFSISLCSRIYVWIIIKLASLVEMIQH